MERRKSQENIQHFRNDGSTLQGNGWTISVRCLLGYIFRLYENERGDSVPEKIYMKICVDGRQLAEGQVGFALTPLNLTRVFGTQEVDSQFYFAVYSGAESREEIETHTQVKGKELGDIEKEGIVCNGRKIDVQFIYTRLKGCR